MKTCIKCEITKPLSEFTERKNRKATHQSTCKVCDKERQRLYRLSNRETINRNELLRRQTFSGRATHLFNDAKKRAKLKNIEFSITLSFVQQLLLIGHCQLSGIPFELSAFTQSRNPWSPSLDRKDNSKGYTLTNTQIVCTIVNMAKNEHCEDDFIKMCNAVSMWKFKPADLL